MDDERYKAARKVALDATKKIIDILDERVADASRPDLDYHSEDKVLICVGKVLSSIVGKPEEVWRVFANGVLRLELGIHHKWLHENFMIREDPKDEYDNYV